jgi:hypothetical protein
VDPSGLSDTCPECIYSLIVYGLPGAGGGGGGGSYEGDKLEALPDMGAQGSQQGSGSIGISANSLLVASRLPSAIGMALVALTKTDCAKLFSTEANGLNPSYLLTQLATGVSRYGFIQIDQLSYKPGTVRSATATQISAPVPIGNDAYHTLGVGVIITINNIAGSFISGNEIDQAVTILHELGHAFNHIYDAGKSLIKDDGEDTKLSESNTKLVKDNCFK